MQRVIALLVLALTIIQPSLAREQAAVAGVRLYALDCGRLEFGDLGPFSDTGEYDGRPGELMASCFLIRHPRGDLLWDAGLGDQYAGRPEGVQLALYRAKVPVSLESQLKEIGLGFDDITYFAFSHGHADHLGNASRLSKATWLVNTRELAWLEATPPPPRTNPSYIEARNRASTILINGDYDVFGDGSVRILAAPGHTPGHQVLLVTFKNHQPVLLSGDLYHSRENRAGRRLPVFNYDRAATLASMDRVEAILRNRGAQLVIQHSTEDFLRLPQPPAFID